VLGFKAIDKAREGVGRSHDCVDYYFLGFVKRVAVCTFERGQSVLAGLLSLVLAVFAKERVFNYIFLHDYGYSNPRLQSLFLKSGLCQNINTFVIIIDAFENSFFDNPLDYIFQFRSWKCSVNISYTFTG